MKGANFSLLTLLDKCTQGFWFQLVVTSKWSHRKPFVSVPGNRHDATMLRQEWVFGFEASGKFQFPDQSTLNMYKDLAYPLHPYLTMPYCTVLISAQQSDFNYRMSKVSSSVEWGFGMGELHHSFLNLKKNNKLFLQAVGKLYMKTSFPKGHKSPNLHVFRELEHLCCNVQPQFF